MKHKIESLIARCHLDLKTLMVHNEDAGWSPIVVALILDELKLPPTGGVRCFQLSWDLLMVGSFVLRDLCRK